jgi:mono/diheme cytochrome c family protein
MYTRLIPTDMQGCILTLFEVCATASTLVTLVFRERTLNLNRPRFLLSTLVSLIAVLVLIACDSEPRKSDAELGLNPQQAAGRSVYDARCAECHYAYSKSNLRGPSLHGLFGKPFMSSGIPANDERVTDIILLGRAKMPAFQNKLTQQQLDDLMVYLHTL